MPRLFAALRPPPAIRRLLLAATGGMPQARWQDDDQLHLTVRFIGEVDRWQAEDVAAALAAVQAQAPSTNVAGVGRFEHRGRTDTLWAAVADSGALAHLHRKVDQACTRAGLEPERRAYRPHVTLARLPRSAGSGVAIDQWLADHAGLVSEPFALSHLMLYESLLGRDGARYEPVARWRLGTAGDTPGSTSIDGMGEAG